MTVLALDPTTGGVDVGAHLALAPRPKSLEGQVLGIVANGLGISEVMFDRLGELLRESDGLAGVVKVRTIGRKAWVANSGASSVSV